MKPPKLQAGDTIAVFSPSSPATKTAYTRYQRGKHYLESKGFSVLEGSLTGRQDGYRSGSIAARAQELNALLHNPQVKCVMAAIGGMNTNSILPYVDYDALRRNPKIIIGYSDVTALLLAVYAKTGLTTYYGPAMAASFGEYPPFVEETFAYFSAVVTGEKKLPFLLPTPAFWTEEFVDWNTQTCAKKPIKNELVTVQGGKVRGRLLGGNLDTMQGIWNTDYFPAIKTGDILFLEDSLKDAACIERSFALLKLSGVFDKIGGLILGKHEHFDDLQTGRKPYEILREVMGAVTFPILAQFDCAHTHPMLTLPIGSMAELDATRQTLTLPDEVEYDNQK
ncbi:MAG: LD-carboxypeptidase [Ruthenibacterium sp.]